MKGQMYLKNVVTLELYEDKCTGCGLCAAVCPHGVFKVEDKAVIIDRDACIECGACMLNCPVDAIEVNAGVGCATAVLRGMFGDGEVTCDCGSDSNKTCC